MANISVWDYQPKDKIRIGKEICDLYREGLYTIDGCCGEKQIKVGTFYRWCKRYEELQEYYKWTKRMADGAYDAQMKVSARQRALARVQGKDTATNYKVKVTGKTETLVFDNPKSFEEMVKQITEACTDGVIIEVSSDTKTIAPSDALLVNILSNVDEWNK